MSTFERLKEMGYFSKRPPQPISDLEREKETGRIFLKGNTDEQHAAEREARKKMFDQIREKRKFGRKSKSKKSKKSKKRKSKRKSKKSKKSKRRKSKRSKRKSKKRMMMW
jgi:hypothetical protein